MYGLGDYEQRVLWTLPTRLRRIVQEEIADGDPQSIEDMTELLQSKDPARTIAREYAREIEETISDMAAYPYDPGAAYEAGMGKSLKSRFKKAVQKVVAPVKKVFAAVKRVENKLEDSVKRIASKVPGAKAVSGFAKKVRKEIKDAGQNIQRIAKAAARKAAPFLGSFPLTSWTLAIKSIRKGTAKFWRGPYGSVIVTVAGAALAPFTFGISAAVATLAVTGRKLYVQKQEAAKLLREQKAEASQAQAEVTQQEAAFNAELDGVYNNAEVHGQFLAIGLTPDKWAALSPDEKLKIIEYLSKGEVPPGYSIVQEAVEGAEQNGTTITDPSQVQAGSPGAGVPRWGGVSPGSGIPPSSGGSYTPTSEEVSAPTGTYELYAEGRKIASSTSLKEITDAIQTMTSPGDRLEVFLDGKSTGLKVRIEGGVVSVPADREMEVRTANRGQVQALVSRATASAEGEKTGFPWWIVGVPIAAAYAVFK